jgi:hypothetical protein
MEDGTTSEFAASLLRDFATDDKRNELLEILYQVGDYELEFLTSYTIHFLDLLDTMRESNEKIEIDLGDIVGYTLEHMGIDGLR